MLNRVTVYTLLLIASVSISTSALEKRDEDPIRVFTGVLPHSFFVKRIGGSHVNVDVMVLPGQNPATYNPSARQASALSKSSVYFAAGVPFEEAFLHKIKNTVKGIRVVDLTRGIKLRKMEAGHDHHGDHEGEPANRKKEETGHVAGARPSPNDQDERGFDPHIWLSPVKALQQAEIIFETLVSLNPALAPEFQAGYDRLLSEITTLHRRIKKTLAPLKGKQLFVFHPAYGYFADTYELTQVAVEMEGKAPDARTIGRFIDLARKNNVGVVFVQPQFSPRSANVIAKAIGGAVVSLDPLSGDYLNNLDKMTDEIEKALGER